MGFRKDLEQDTIINLPIREAIAIQPTTSIRDAVELMRAKSLGCAVIVQPDNTPSGIFTEQSLLKLLSQGSAVDDRPVQEFADPGFLALKTSEPIARVWDAIQGVGLRFICVTDEDGKLIGVTGQRGMAEYVAECFPQQVVVQRLGSTPWMQTREGA